MIIDVQDMTAVLNDHPDDLLQLIKSDFNDRTRFTKSKKAVGDQFDISALGGKNDQDKYENRISRYGFLWSDKVKGDRFAVPSLQAQWLNTVNTLRPASIPRAYHPPL